jgi:hypothetical protein
MKLQQLIGFFLFGGFAILVGAVVGLNVNLFTGLLAGLIGAAAFFLIPTWTVACVLFVLTFVVQGTVKSFLGSNMLGWAASGLGLILLVRVLLDGMVGSARNSSTSSGRNQGPAMVMLVLYLVVFALSMVVNWPPLLQAVSAAKNVLPMLAILFAVYRLQWTLAQMTKLWLLVLVITFLQLPFAVYQHFFVAASRATQGWDSVVGTMGGNQDGGGLNAMLVTFCLSGLAYMLARVRHGLSSSFVGWITTIVVLAIIALGEVKAAFVWLPLVFLFFFGAQALRNPLKAVAYVMVSGVVITALFVAYEQLYWKGDKLSQGTVTERIEKMSSYFFDVTNVNYRTGEISRGASLALWWQDSKSNVLTRTIGFGPGASKSFSVLGKGEVAKRYSPLNLDATTTAVHLWDTGLLGALAYAGALLLVLLQGWRLHRDKSLDPASAAMLEASVVTLAMMCTLLIYNRTLTDEPPAQLLLYFAFGTVLRISYSVKTATAHKPIGVAYRQAAMLRPTKSSG